MLIIPMTMLIIIAGRRRQQQRRPRWRLLLRLWLNLEDLEIAAEFARYARRTLYPAARVNT